MEKHGFFINFLDLMTHNWFTFFEHRLFSRPLFNDDESSYSRSVKN